MNEPAFIRARSPEHKAQRAAMILSAAALILDRDGIDGVTLAAIAKEAGVVKSNLYRYFESREEILFRLMLSETVGLVDACERAMENLPTNDIAAISAEFARLFASSPRFCLLISQMAPILERNISVETLIEMKRETVGNIFRIAKLLHQKIPDLGEVGAVQALHSIIYQIAGLWPMANPPAAVLKALEQPDLSFMKLDFEPAMAQTFEFILEGVCAKAAK